MKSLTQITKLTVKGGRDVEREDWRCGAEEKGGGRSGDEACGCACGEGGGG